MKILFFGFETASQYVSIAIMDGISTILEGKKNAAEAKSPVADLEAQARYVVQLMENETRESSEMFRVRWTTVQWQSSNHQYQVPRRQGDIKIISKNQGGQRLHCASRT